MTYGLEFFISRPIRVRKALMAESCPIEDWVCLSFADAWTCLTLPLPAIIPTAIRHRRLTVFANEG